MAKIWLEHPSSRLDTLSREEREAILRFSFLWSEFESVAFNPHGDASVLIATTQQWVDAGLFTEELFRPHLAYFSNRYYRDGRFTHNFSHLNLQESVFCELIRRVFKDEPGERYEFPAAILLIVYGIRTIFYDDDWLDKIQGRLEIINHANAVLTQAIKLTRQLQKQQYLTTPVM